MKLNLIATALSFFQFRSVGSTFDANSFAAGSFEGEGDTRRFQYPPGEYPAIILGAFNEDKKTRLFTTEKGQLQLIVVWQPDDEALRQQMKLEKLPTVSQRIFLDLTETNALDMGPFKNGELNKLRTAFGLNRAGVKWSFQDFIGKAAKIKIEQRPNKEDPANPYSNVTAVTAM